jgi:hypothetical protein
METNAMKPIHDPHTHNTPDLPSLSSEEYTSVDEARTALASIKRSFEFWMVIAHGLQTLKDKADRIGGRFTFDRLREREGLGGRRRDGTDILNKTRVCRLLAIRENEPDVIAWRHKLSQKQQFDWASPEAVFRHCPVFAKPRPDDPSERPISKAEQDRQALAAALEENRRLKQGDGSLFDIKRDTAATIVRVLTDPSVISETKATTIAQGILKAFKAKQKPAG